MAGPISTFVNDVGRVVKEVLNVIVFEKPLGEGPLPFRPDSKSVSSFAVQLETKAAEALRKLREIEDGISDKRGRGGMPRAAVRQARQVIRGARSIITALSQYVHLAPVTADLATFKKTPAFSSGLRPMVQWLLPMVREGIGADAPILAQWAKIASRFPCLVFAAVAVGGLLAWNHFNRQNYC